MQKRLTHPLDDVNDRYEANCALNVLGQEYILPTAPTTVAEVITVAAAPEGEGGEGGGEGGAEGGGEGGEEGAGAEGEAGAAAAEGESGGEEAAVDGGEDEQLTFEGRR